MTTNYKFPELSVYNIGIGAAFVAGDMVVDNSGNVYVADTVGCVIWKIDYTTKNATIVAGSGIFGVSTDGVGTLASIYYPTGLAIDSTNTYLYIAEQQGMKIKRMTLSNNTVITIAGSGGSTSVDGSGTLASFSYPTGIVIDPSNTYLYVTDYGSGKVRKIQISNNDVTTISSSFTSPNGPVGITINSTNTHLYVTDRTGRNVASVRLSDNLYTNIAGNGTQGYTDSTGSSATFYYPKGITIDSTNTNLYVADYGKIRKVVISSGVVTSIAGTGNIVSGKGDKTFIAGVSASNSLPELSSVRISSGDNLYIGTVDLPLYFSNNIIKHAAAFPTGYSMDFSDAFIPRDLFAQGGLWTWGVNNFGQIGDDTTLNRSSPVQTISAGTNWKQVSFKGNTSSGIKTDGTLWSMGNNNSGNLGDNTITRKSSPVQTISGGTNWKYVSTGAGWIGSIKTDGTLWLWGINQGGQLGTNDAISRSSPVQTISGGTNWKDVSCFNNTAAIKTDGTLWLWGPNTNGSLGTNDILPRSSPVQTISGGTNWKRVSSGGNYTAAIKTNGTLWTWGDNSNGQLGTNDILPRSSPVQTISADTNWKYVSATGAYCAAIKTDGTLWLWGSNSSGGLGDNTTIFKSSPVQTVSGGANWKVVDVGSLATMAIKTDGTLWLWGGYVGDNTTITKSSPVQTIAGGTNWKTVSSGNAVAAITDIY